MTAKEFTKRWLLALSALVLFAIAFAFMVGPLIRATGCQRFGGACGAVALIWVSSCGAGGDRSRIVQRCAVMGLTMVPFLNQVVWPISFSVMRLLSPVLRYLEPFLTIAMLLAFIVSLACWISSGRADHAAVA